MHHAPLTALLLCAVLVHTPRTVAACIGDCDGDARVTVNEIVAAVATLLGEARGCPAGVRTIDDLVRAVANVGHGCPAATATNSPTSGPSRTATATPTPTHTPAITRTPSASPTPSSCVSEAPAIRDGAAPLPDDPFIWKVDGYSRILLHGRGSVHACLNDRTPVPVSRPGGGVFALEVPVNRLGRNRLAVCTSPSRCGTPYCARRDIYCNGLGCTFSGPRPTARPTPGFCQAE